MGEVPTAPERPLGDTGHAHITQRAFVVVSDRRGMAEALFTLSTRPREAGWLDRPWSAVAPGSVRSFVG